MRKLLEALYGGAAWLAALLMLAVLVMVMLSIISRLAGFHVPGTDAYAGYAMAGAGFMALAHTLKRAEHIRVTLLITALRGRMRRGLEIWSLVVASLLASLLAFYSCRLVWQSKMFNDISTGNDATPLWIPQLSMALGTVIFAIAFVDETVLELRGRRQQPAENEPLRNE
jgi:TRAP-type C4-dicarboxylate transport system permease small subunit